MFDVGFWEIVVIAVVALMVVGPKRLPKMARTVGLYAGKIRFYVNQVREDIEREVRAEELREMLDKRPEIDDLYDIAEETRGTLDDAAKALDEPAERETEPSADAPAEATPEPDGGEGDASAGIFPTEGPSVVDDTGPDADDAREREHG